MKRAAPTEPDPPSQRDGNLFQFNLAPTVPLRRWCNVVDRQRFRATLDQNWDPHPQDDLGNELTAALRQAIEMRLQTTPGLQPWHYVHFTMQSDHFSHAFQSTTFTVQEFRGDSERLRTYLQALAAKLNSNEDFEADDSFIMHTTIVCTPGRGGRGRHDRGHKLGRQSLEKMLRSKKSIIRIQNDDDLCCARTKVTMKALTDAQGDSRDPDYVNLRKGRPIQGRKACELHALAGVPEGPCGIPELTKFQAVLSNHQIKVLSIDKPHMITFAGPPQELCILLVKVGEHYHGCNSFGGFLDTAYFCHDCNKGYSNEDHHNHPCEGTWCLSCQTRSCEDFKTAKRALPPGQYPKATRFCSSCNRFFHGDNCYAKHLEQTTRSRSVCERTKRCLACQCVYEAAPPNRSDDADHPKYRHRCGIAECRMSFLSKICASRHTSVLHSTGHRG